MAIFEVETLSSPVKNASSVCGADKETSGNNDWKPLIPGLPDEVAELCLLHLPYPYHALVRSVSCPWNRAITHPSFLLRKKSLSRPYLFVLASHKSTARIQWQALDPSSGRWFVLPPMPLPFPDSDAVQPSAFACASLPRQGKLFVMGGTVMDSDSDSDSDNETPMRNNLVYSASTNRWAAASPMPTARSHFAAGTVNGRIVTVGGSGTRTVVEIYDPESDTWATGARTMGTTELARYESAVVGSRMFVTDGWRWPFIFRPGGAVYDAEGNTWREMGEGMREGWTGVSVAACGRVFLLPEYGEIPVKVYDEEGDTWRHVGGDRFPWEAIRRPFAAAAVEGRIYVVSCGLNVAIGTVVVVYEHEHDRDRDRDRGKGVSEKLRWEVVEAPEAFREFSPSNCQVLYA